MSSSNNSFVNVVTLLEQYVKMQMKKKDLEKQLLRICDKCDYDNIDEIDKMEEEINFLFGYSKTLIEQATVIINENNVQNVPSIDDIEKNLLM